MLDKELIPSRRIRAGEVLRTRLRSTCYTIFARDSHSCSSVADFVFVSSFNFLSKHMTPRSAVALPLLLLLLLPSSSGNNHRPRIFSFNAGGMINDTTTHVLVISDQDSGEAGRLRCWLVCSISDPCPFGLHVISDAPHGNLLIASVSLASAQTSIEVSCSDKGREPKTTNHSLLTSESDGQLSNVTEGLVLSLIHISEPTRPLYISYAVFC